MSSSQYRNFFEMDDAEKRAYRSNVYTKYKNKTRSLYHQCANAFGSDAERFKRPCSDTLRRKLFLGNFGIRTGPLTPKRSTPKRITPKRITPKKITPKTITPKKIPPKQTKPELVGGLTDEEWKELEAKAKARTDKRSRISAFEKFTRKYDTQLQEKKRKAIAFRDRMQRVR